MNRNDVIKYVKEKYNTKVEYLWLKYPKYGVLRHQNNKWYGIIMNVPKNKLGLDGNDEIDIIDLKCEVDMIGNLRMSEGYLQAYHMNKEHWISVILDGKVDKEQIKNLIDISYDLTNK